MYEYSSFVQMVRNYLDAGELRDTAIQKAMFLCQKEGIMTDFIREHGSEVQNMLFTEFNMEDALEVRYEEGIEKGELTYLIRLVCRKLQKGKTSEQIAEELEEAPKLIQNIIHTAKSLDTFSDYNQIYRNLDLRP